MTAAVVLRVGSVVVDVPGWGWVLIALVIAVIGRPLAITLGRRR